MPWKIADVDKHKKGLSDEQKTQWVAVANSALASCLKKGRKLSECDGSAIRQANSVVGNARGEGQGVGGPKQGDGGTDKCVCPACGKESSHDRGKPCTGQTCSSCGAKMTGKVVKTNSMSGLRHLMSNLVRKDRVDDKEYFVVPTVLIVEGVHHGLSGGKTYYPTEELGKFPDAWNGRPVVVMHPESGGIPTTASSPELLEEQTVGQLFHCKYEGNKLKGESWIDVEKCKKISPEVMAMLQNNQPIEVSTGLFVEYEMKEGNWNGEGYDNVAYNYRPDHLALLPGGVGACSWQDGAGMPRINKEGDKDVNDNSVLTLVKKLASLVGVKTQVPNVLELSHERIRSAISEKVQGEKSSVGRGGEDISLYIVEVFDKYTIYENADKTWKQAYSIDAKDVVELVGDPVEVKRKVTYIPVQSTNLQRKQNSKEGGPNMDRKKKVEALIANGSWGEDSKEFLTELEDVQFDAIEKLVQNQKSEDADKDKEKDADKDKEKEPVTLEAMLKVKPEAEEPEAVKTAREAYDKALAGNEEDSEKKEEAEGEDKPKTVEEFIANAPADFQDTLQRAYKRDKQIKADLVKGLLDNKRNSFAKEELEGKSLNELEGLIKLAQIEVNFGGKNPEIKDEDEVPTMPKMEWKKDK